MADLPHSTPSKRRTPTRSRISRQSSSTSLNVGLPPPLPSSSSLDMTIEASASSRSLRSGQTPGKSLRKTPRIRRGDVSSSATSADESDPDPPSPLSEHRREVGDGMLLVPLSLVKASPTITMDLDMELDGKTTPRRKVAMPIEPMTVGRGGNKRQTLQERLADAARMKKSQSHGNGFGVSGGSGEMSLMGASQAVREGSTGKDKVVVCLRIKPTSSPFMESAYELSSTSLTLSDKHPNVVKRGGKIGREAEYTYPVDMLLRQPSKTPELYTSKIAPLVQKAMNGFNSTIFAYGQTGSGKSFTMTGTSSELGVIPCAVDGVFDAITADRDRAFLLRVSYVEIYNEGLRDLLNFAEGKREVPVIHSGKGKVYVAPLVEEIVATPQDVMKLLSKGNEGRKIGATDWNERSSRSHCVFTIVIESRPRDTSSRAGSGDSTGEDGEADEDIRLSRLNLIDLAGSEKAVSDVERRGEGKHINQSLLALREVINKLTEKKRSHIPYRNSKLTHLLENALGGDSNICVICTMSAEEEHVAETLETLKFAGRCSQVETKAQKNVLPSSEKALIRAKDAEIEELKRRLNGLAGPAAMGVSADKDEQVAELAESVADLEERKKRLTVKLAKLNGEILTSELPRLDGLMPLSPAKPKRRRISEFLGHDRPKTPTTHRRAVSGKPPSDDASESVQPKDLFSDRATSTLRAALSAKDTEIATLRAALLAAQNAASSNTSTLLDSAHQLEMTRSELASNIEDKQQKIDTLESSILDLRKSREDILIEDQSRLDAVQRKLDMANAELQRVQREATGDLPSDLEREKEAFRQDLAQMERTHEVERARLKGEMGRLREQLKERWDVAEVAVVQRQETQIVNAQWEKEVLHAREAVERYDGLLARSRELEEQAKEAKEVKRRVDFLEASNTALQAELSRVEAEAKDHPVRIGELETLVDDLRAERMDAMAKVADMEFDLVSLKEDLEAREKDLGRTKEELERRTEQLAQRDVEYELAKGKLGKEVDGAKGQVEGLKGEVQRLQAELSQKAAEAGAAGDQAKELERVRADLVAVQGEKEALVRDIQAARDEIEANAVTAQSAQKRFQDLETRIADTAAELAISKEEHQSTQRDLEETRQHKSAVETELSESKDRHATASAELDSVRSLAGGNDAMLERLRADVEIAQTKTRELKESKAALEAELAKVKEQSVAAGSIQEELHTVKAELQAANVERSRLEAEAGELRSSAGERDEVESKLRDEVAAATAGAKELAGQVDNLQAQLLKAEDEVKLAQDMMEKKRVAMEGTVKELETLRQSADGAASQHAERIGQLEQAVADCKAQLGQAMKERDEALTAKSTLEASAAKLQTTIDSLQATTTEDDSRMVQLRTDIDDLTRQLEARSVEVSDLTRRIEEEQAAKQAALDGAAKDAAGLAELQQRLVAAEKDTAKLADVQTALDQAKEAVRKQEQRVAELVKQLEDGSAGAADDKAKLEQAEAAVHKQEQRVAELEKQLQDGTADAADTKAKLEQAEASISGIVSEREQARQTLASEVAKAVTTRDILAKAEAERDMLSARVDALEKTAGTTDEAAQQLRATVDSLKQELSVAKTALSDTRSREQASSNASKDAEQRYQHAQADLAALRAKVTDLEETLLASEQDDKAARDRYASLKRDLAAVESQRDQARDTASTAKDERDTTVKALESLRASSKADTAKLDKARAEVDAKTAQLAAVEKESMKRSERITKLEKELQSVKDGAATAAKSTVKRRTSTNGRNTLPTIESGDLDGSAQDVVQVMQAKYREEITHLETVIEEQQKTIDVQREKIIFWSNELEKQREVVRMLTSTPESPSRSTQQGAGTRHIKAHSISDSPSRIVSGRGGSKENADPAAPTGAADTGKKALTGTFTARNLALPSAPTPLPMHTGQYSNTAARKARRITIDHDMEALSESNKIAQAKAIFDTPEKAASKAAVLGNTPKQRRPWADAV